jgi:hypothetical protein
MRRCSIRFAAALERLAQHRCGSGSDERRKESPVKISGRCSKNRRKFFFDAMSTGKSRALMRRRESTQKNTSCGAMRP